MSRLVLVRHAQASFFADDYDQLSSLGESQARALGAYWTRIGVAFDEVFAGPRRRHAQTAEIAGAVCRKAGVRWPDAEVLAGFDEHPVDELLGESLEKLVKLHANLAPLAAEYRSAMLPEQKQRSFQRLFEAVCHLWSASEPGTESIISWSDFHQRVENELRLIMERTGKNRMIAVFTSVGNITAALCSVLKCAPAQALELGWRLKNCSVTELIFSGNRITLDQFNSVAHLPDPKTWTFR
jgi:broad specificity phosphatase PhoE